MLERRVDAGAVRAAAAFPSGRLAEEVGGADVLERQEGARFDLQHLADIEYAYRSFPPAGRRPLSRDTHARADPE